MLFVMVGYLLICYACMEKLQVIVDQKYKMLIWNHCVIRDDYVLIRLFN